MEWFAKQVLCPQVLPFCFAIRSTDRVAVAMLTARSRNGPCGNFGEMRVVVPEKTDNNYLAGLPSCFPKRHARTERTDMATRKMEEGTRQSHPWKIAAERAAEEGRSIPRIYPLLKATMVGRCDWRTREVGLRSGEHARSDGRPEQQRQQAGQIFAELHDTKHPRHPQAMNLNATAGERRSAKSTGGGKGPFAASGNGGPRRRTDRIQTAGLARSQYRRKLLAATETMKDRVEKFRRRL